MKKSFKYRLYPKHQQVTRLNQTLDSCRFLYNHFLNERKIEWEQNKKSISCFDQIKTLPNLKNDHEHLNNIHSQVLQNIANRINLAFQGFFRRVHSPEKPGYPRFKGKYRYDSFTFPQSGFKLLKDKVKLSKIGSVKMNYHRPVEGSIKTCTVKKSLTGKWYVTFSCEIEENIIQQQVEPAVGIDMGLESFATFSNGYKVENKRFFRQEEKELKKVQRKFSKQNKGSKLRKKYRKTLARVHERIKFKRENFAHQEARKIINKFNTVCVEDLHVKDMQINNFKGMNKSIQDVAWKKFIEFLSFKAEEAGKKLIQVNPAYTTQICSSCGNKRKLKLSDRIYNCNNCGFTMDRDKNAALNILALGLQGLVLT